MATKVVECLDWGVQDQPGEMLRYAEIFKKAGVNLDAFWAYHSKGGEPKIAAIGKKGAKLKAALKNYGIEADASRCFCVTGKDRAGALVDALKALSGAGINVTCADALAVSGKFAAVLWVGGPDFARAKKLLKAT